MVPYFSPSFAAMYSTQFFASCFCLQHFTRSSPAISSWCISPQSFLRRFLSCVSLADFKSLLSVLWLLTSSSLIRCFLNLFSYLISLLFWRCIFFPNFKPPKIPRHALVDPFYWIAIPDVFSSPSVSVICLFAHFPPLLFLCFIALSFSALWFSNFSFPSSHFCVPLAVLSLPFFAAFLWTSSPRGFLSQFFKIILRHFCFSIFSTLSFSPYVLVTNVAVSHFSLPSFRSTPFPEILQISLCNSTFPNICWSVSMNSIPFHVFSLVFVSPSSIMATSLCFCHHVLLAGFTSGFFNHSPHRVFRPMLPCRLFPSPVFPCSSSLNIYSSPFMHGPFFSRRFSFTL